MDSGLEKIDYLVAYTHGYSDAKAGRTADSRTRMKEALVKSDTSKTGSAQPSPGELADRAAAYQSDKAKAGIAVSNMDAVKHAYEEAGIPLG